MPSFRSSRRCPGAFPSRAILKGAGGGGRIPVSRSFFFRGPALRLVRRLAPFGRPVPVSSRPPPLRSLSAHFSLRESAIRCADEYRTRAPCSEHRTGRTRRRAATTANCALSQAKGRAPPAAPGPEIGGFPRFRPLRSAAERAPCPPPSETSGGAKGCGRGRGRCETGPSLPRGGRYSSTP